MESIKKLKLNTGFSIFNQIVLIISGLILPRFILKFYGSDINGLISSITQFLNIITFLELGVGGVVQSALYDPIFRKDTDKIDRILSAAKRYFNLIAKFLIIYVLILAILYPRFVENPLDSISTVFLIFSMSIGLFAQYYFGIVNQLMLNSDQKAYIHISWQSLLIIVNTIVSILLIINGYSITTVKFISGLIFLARPAFLNYYVKNNYQLNADIKNLEDELPQKWNGVAQHVAYTVLNSTDIVVLTLFSSLQNVSIYSVYYMVVNGVKLLVSSVTNGFQAFFGNLLVATSKEKLNSYFSETEWLIHSIVTFLFGMTSILIVPFVDLYTNGVKDANYHFPIFAILITLTQMIYCLRLPYYSIINAAGHFKETQTSAIIEALLNIIISIVLVIFFGLIGVAIGTLVAMLYRTLYLVFYLSKNILYRKIQFFVKNIIVDFVTFILFFILGNFYSPSSKSYVLWFKDAIFLGIVGLFICFLINWIFYNKQTNKLISSFIRK